MEINKDKPVMVTGANGYVASWLVKKLLDNGFTVHACVRDVGNEKKIAHLKHLAAQSKGQLKFFAADLLKMGSYAQAMQGCELVFHTASPFVISKLTDVQKELIEPAVKGTENVLAQANQTPSVKRVVLTSSCAAIYGDSSDLQSVPGGMFTEEHWNQTSSLEHNPYSYSKTLAEKRAWEMVKAQKAWDLVVINPSLVAGPPLNPEATTSGTMDILTQLGDGTMRLGAPNLCWGVVDVRDVADAHYAAGFNPKAHGRHIVSGYNTSLLEMAQVLQSKYGRYPLPRRAIPKWLVSIMGPLTNPAYTRKVIQNNVNWPWRGDNSKSRRELQVQYRPLQTTMEESFAALIEHGVLKKI